MTLRARFVAQPHEGRMMDAAHAAVCRVRGHDWEGWLAPPMRHHRQRLNSRTHPGPLPAWLFRCHRCHAEKIRYPDGEERSL